ncbi:hypothetical protein HPTD01_1412 [Halomonas sp. TD01]|nr:hypothetical protein GME_09234 [Halomonas sp. TD01]CAH1042934.1 hypothetical protein HPTD01_1412 [Halomonas sp. TD01]
MVVIRLSLAKSALKVLANSLFKSLVINHYFHFFSFDAMIFNKPQINEMAL